MKNKAFIFALLSYQMRGQNLFQDLFTDVAPAPSKQEGKGRNLLYDAKRNELLLNRYFFYGKYSTKRYEVIIQTLSDEFFLTERRIQDLMSINHDLLIKLRSAPPSVTDLRKRWPHLVW